MTKTENRAAARAYAVKQKRQFEEDQERATARPTWERCGSLRDYLIFKAKHRGDAYDCLKVAIDDYAGELTGDRTALHAKPVSMGR